jgi:septal ring factor EnvC (AmiA/AmiB activator)
VGVQLRETQKQFERVNSELWAKVDENNKLLMAVKELERRCHEYENQADLYEGGKIGFQKQLERDAKFNEARLE